ARFWPDKPVSCPCGAPFQTVEHVIASCPLHAAARQEHLRPIDHDYSLPKLLGTLQGGAAMLKFLKETQA
ncbi:hypothetical protein BJV78DRAFT_1086984, partial [Lactifluus subvellereus]